MFLLKNPESHFEKLTKLNMKYIELFHDETFCNKTDTPVDQVGDNISWIIFSQYVHMKSW